MVLLARVWYCTYYFVLSNKIQHVVVSLFSLFPSSKKLLHFSVAPHHHHAEVLRPHVRVTFTDECFLCVSVCCLQVRVGRRALGLDWGEEKKIESIQYKIQTRERECVCERELQHIVVLVLTYSHAIANSLQHIHTCLAILPCLLFLVWLPLLLSTNLIVSLFFLFFSSLDWIPCQRWRLLDGDQRQRLWHYKVPERTPR